MLGRVLFGLVFLFLGVNKAMYWSLSELAFAEDFARVVQNAVLYDVLQDGLKVLEAYSSWVLGGVVLCEILGGGLLLVGGGTRVAGCLLFFSLLVTTFILHPFWWFPPGEQNIQFLLFIKNVSLIGAALILMESSPSRGDATT